MAIDRTWLDSACAQVSDDQIVGPGQGVVPDAVDRIEALFQVGSVSFAAKGETLAMQDFEPDRADGIPMNARRS